MHEAHGLPVDESLVLEFIQYEKTALGFMAYYRTVQSLLTREEMGAILNGTQERAVMDKLQDFSFQERWAVLMCLMALLGRRIGAVLDKIRAHDKWYGQLKEKAAPEEKEAFRRTTAALDGELNEARAQVDNTLSFIQTVFGDGREAEILIGRMLENEQFQEFSAHRRLEKLIELYQVFTARRGEAMKRIRAWAGAQPEEPQEPPVSRVMCS